MAKQAATHRELILAGVEAERELAEIARTRRPTDEETARARKAYRAAAKASKTIDELIGVLYPKLASGRQIDIMKIPALFRTATLAYQNGVDLESAVLYAIESHCDPVASAKQIAVEIEVNGGGKAV